jgi:phospholipase/carboxylesterase
MTSSALETIQVDTGPNPTASVIWLHGLGASGDDFVPIVRELDLSGLPAIRFIFPHAPTMPVTVNNGYVMRAWYDIIGADLSRREDENCLSGYVPLHTTIAAERNAANQQTPIFLAHGRGDQVIPIVRAEQSRDLLKSLGYDVEWHEYMMPHSVCQEEVEDIGAWFRRVLA